MDRWQVETLRLTFVLLVAAVTLILPGVLGVAASFGLAFGLGVAAGVLFAGRDVLGTVSPVAGWPAARYLRVLWVGPAVAALIVAIALDATPGEVQALGGLVGLVAMANYFLRPVYFAIVSAGRYVAGQAR